MVRSALRTDHPLALLETASAFASLAEGDLLDRLREPEAQGPTLEDIAAMLADTDLPETTALLAALRCLLPPLARRRAERELARRSHAGVPAWVDGLDRPEPVEAWEHTHILGDGDNVVVSWRWPSGHEATVVTYIDHNMGTIVKDAFAVPEPAEQVLDLYRSQIGDDPATTLRPLDRAAARARIEQAIDMGARTLGVERTETWPDLRPLLQWLVTFLPGGGTGYEHPITSPDERLALARELARDPAFSRLAADPDLVPVLDDLLWFACDYGTGDPLRWSPVSVEILLADWYPRKVHGPKDYLVKVPDVLRALIGAAHGRRQIPPALTDETMDAIDIWEVDYLDAIGAPPGDNAYLLAERVRALVEPAPETYLADGSTNPEFVLWAQRVLLAGGSAFADWTDRQIAEWELGGPVAAASLDAEPFDDEPLDLTGIAPDLVDRAREVCAVSDLVCDELFDVEARTICRRAVARLARTARNVLTRGRADILGAAVVLLVAERSELLRPMGGSTVTKKAVCEAAGVKYASVTNRTITLAHPIGLYQITSPELLHSHIRAEYLDRLSG